MMQLQILEPNCEWRAEDVADESLWTEHFSAEELAEIDAAIAQARRKADNFLEIGKADFPLPKLGERLKSIAHELMHGRGFVRLRGLPRARYTNDEMCLAYWGIGAHLGRPWAQNKYGHLLGDVTDQGKAPDDPTSRGNEIGGVGLEFHCDGSDLVGLMCLSRGAEGGRSMVANSVSLHNTLVRERPDLAEALYESQPYDFRGEHAPGSRAWYTLPVFTALDGRLFCRMIFAYILASQRHADAPRLTPKAREALEWMKATAESGRFTAEMDLEPGDMQFINNYHVLHGRAPYQDDRANGKVRHLKRLWLETDEIANRPPYFRNNLSSHWGSKPKISRLDAVN